MNRQSPLLNRSPWYKTGWLRIVLAVIALVLLNGIFQYVALRFGYKRYFLGFELLVAVVFFALGYRWSGLLLFLSGLVLEIVLGLTGLFHFMNVREALDMAEFALLARPEDIFWFVASLVLVVGCFWVAGTLLSGVRFSRMALIGGVFVVGLTYGQWSISEERGEFFTPVLASQDALLFGSASFLLKNTLDLNRVKQAVDGNPDIEYHKIRHPSAADGIMGESPDSRRILFVISEAWGLPRDPNILEKQILSLRNSAHVQGLELNSVYARGATAAGELRELCGLIPSRMNFGKMTSELVGECLPKKLKTLGYRTVAVHGADSGMYRRSRWYPILGFEQMFFKDDMPASESHCYSFPGYCDRNIFPVVRDQLKNDQVFVYWLTLNTHVPYDRRDISQYREELCSVFTGESSNEMLCNYQNLHAQFFDGLANLIKDDALRGVEVVVVGDHAPIFLDGETRERFERERVPVLHFKVK
ncbi:sulfatase-like hydrolase/transferase [Hydrogenophaga pseudoflava]|jgi:hypothetical protein|uniref:sulfatase-like hydrolase/transferase n=1 Tax=Hydrogenophaga pseudoflava TaxID=47421 RepID=UPI000ACF226D|nr:sulfatase-like hydrolase/transferase [Hydrogenophaga pseudoflava]